ncbi:putative assembly protein [Pseudovibrio axinellae]|uniref:Putative assembly protein n=1 Tax=Pseudovibrio axinellae TaxID=989403 RepID=A0A166A765_9HYPH|nr:AsmA family protein [Pseudovibrio axinellae]KZL20688.1 putative assembly protein [Pseudovibrio axinellae]SER25646.1 AsmA protein [Pseudovibrio axinellae]
MKRSLIIFGALAALVVCGLVLAPLLVPQQQLKAQIAQTFETATGWKLRLDGRTSVDLFPTLAIEIENVGVAGAARADGIEFAQVDRARFELNSLRLLTGGNIIRNIELFKPKWTLEFDQEGSASWQPLLSGDGEGAHIGANIAGRVASFMRQLDLDTVKLNDGVVTYSELKQESPLLFSEISMMLNFEHGGDALTADGAFTQGGERYAVRGRVGSVSALSEARATSVEAHLIGPSQEKVGFTGQLAFGARPVGTVQVLVEVPSLSEVAAQHNVELPEDVGNGVLTSEVQFRQRGMRSKDLSITIGSVGFGGDVALNYLEDGFELKGQVNGKSLDFEQLIRLAGLNFPASGFANVDASFYSVGQSYDELVSALEIDGGAILRKGRIASIQLPELLAVEDRQEALDDMDLSFVFSGLSNPLELKGTARWQGEQVWLQGGLRSDANIDLAFSSEMFSGSVTGPYSLKDGFGGILAFQTDDFSNFARWYGRPLPRYLHGKQLELAGVFDADANGVAFKDAQFKLDQTTIKGSGRIDTAEVPKISGRLEVANASFDKMFSRSDAKNAKGESAYDFSVLRSFDLDVDLSIKDLKLGALKGQNADLKAELSDGRLALEVTQVDLYKGEGAGKLLLNGATVKPGISAEFSLQGIDAAPFLASLGDMPRVDGNLYAEVDVNTSGQTPSDLWVNMGGALSFQLGNGTLHELDVDRLVASVGNGGITGWPFEEADRTSFSSWGADVIFDRGTAEFQALTLQSKTALVEGRGAINIKDGEVLWYLQPSLLDKSKLNGEPSTQTSDLAPLKIRGSIGLPSFEKVGHQEYADASFGDVKETKKVSEKLAQDLVTAKTVKDAQRLRASAAKEAADRSQLASGAELVSASDLEEGTEGENTASIGTGDLPLLADGEIPSADASSAIVIPVAKPEGTAVAANEVKTPRKSKLTGAPKRDLKRRDVVPRGPGNVDVEAVAAGTADTDATLTSLEEAFGMPAGFLTD